MQEKFHHTVVHKVDVQNLYAKKGAFPKLSQNVVSGVTNEWRFHLSWNYPFA